jgi:hypothetical protein
VPKSGRRDQWKTLRLCAPLTTQLWSNPCDWQSCLVVTGQAVPGIPAFTMRDEDANPNEIALHLPPMPESLYLSFWFPGFDTEDILPRALTVMRHFPFSAQQPGITYVALHPVSWNEPTVLEQRYRPGISPEQAVLVASDLLHEDYAYLFEAFWDLWVPVKEGDQWTLQPSQVRFFAHGLNFDEGAYEEDGHIQVDFGLDIPFLYEGVALTETAEEKVRANVQKLVAFTTQAEKASGATARLLWSESDENLAQKLIMRLQKVQ